MGDLEGIDFDGLETRGFITAESDATEATGAVGAVEPVVVPDAIDATGGVQDEVSGSEQTVQ